MTMVRCPSRAHRRAVAAATEVLPTPPFPVNRMTRTELSVGARRRYLITQGMACAPKKSSTTMAAAVRARLRRSLSR